MEQPRTAENWIRYAGPSSQPELRLFCFPYGGGGASLFRAWSDSLPSSVQVIPIQLPGHEDRLLESPYVSLEPLVATLANVLTPTIEEAPYAFFGHSMGALIGFELSRELRRRDHQPPVCLYVSGFRAPQLPDPEPPVHDLPQDEFVAKLRSLSGTPDQILENEEMMALILPTLRADFAIVETYQYAAQEPLACPIVAFGGVDDQEFSRADVQAWREQTNAEFDLWMLPGDHFFIHDSQERILGILAQDLFKRMPQ